MTPKIIKPHTDMIEGAEAWERFHSAMKTIIRVPKRALPPSPFKKQSGKETNGRQGKVNGNKSQ